MGKHVEIQSLLGKEASLLHNITDEQLLNTLNCPGFSTIFKPESLQFINNKYGPQQMIHTGAQSYIRRGHIIGQDGNDYSVSLIRDLDNAGVVITAPDNNQLAKVMFRDRHNDGTLESTPPKFLRSLGNYSGPIPGRSLGIGSTPWCYTFKGDKQPSGRKSVEFSIVSSSPEAKLVDLLTKKQDRLSVDANELSIFIDDPFEYIPTAGNITPDNIDYWWTLWWHVVQRGIRGKEIPYPGQLSKVGFKGFFRHVLSNAKELLQPQGFTHLSGIPTWKYVWDMNLSHGFLPDDPEQHQEAVDFFERMRTIELPDGKKLSDIDPRSSLHSWIAVAPFAMQLDPQYQPKLKIDHKYTNGDFDKLFKSMQETLVTEDKAEVHTYPFYPGRNLWHSLDLKNINP
ncbi:hypothetical protein COZ40_02340 [Candidatus Roizmanbacteria bacterium CG_4_10_14_3_um_filter_39_13]|uniref:Uncharacterized protein n=2 Tax=Candidatus Roizmaniibacteriota TaxID=1752723 RepID=A0A2H0KJY4_9BACT|nr:MAG: hypothetical protein COV87_02630 [Candidatus Roizmanbacteria bacterium CG11_big_fil_rev_8_21_14_0_20_37_16]PIX68613.1 MAG: hypothetical protein COZ40_02340 [Candidatus Roizmanbacteria bacterium CG_4_10_14_3_um_filter_39_13]